MCTIISFWASPFENGPIPHQVLLTQAQTLWSRGFCVGKKAEGSIFVSRFPSARTILNSPPLLPINGRVSAFAERGGNERKSGAAWMKGNNISPCLIVYATAFENSSSPLSRMKLLITFSSRDTGQTSWWAIMNRVNRFGGIALSRMGNKEMQNVFAKYMSLTYASNILFSPLFSLTLFLLYFMQCSSVHKNLLKTLWQNIKFFGLESGTHLATVVSRRFYKLPSAPFKGNLAERILKSASISRPENGKIPPPLLRMPTDAASGVVWPGHWRSETQKCAQNAALSLPGHEVSSWSWEHRTGVGRSPCSFNRVGLGIPDLRRPPLLLDC